MRRSSRLTRPEPSATAAAAPQPTQPAAKRARLDDVKVDVDGATKPKAKPKVRRTRGVASRLHSHTESPSRDAEVVAGARIDSASDVAVEEPVVPAQPKMKHVVFVIHGIGEQINTTPSLWDNVEKIEKSARELVDAHLLSSMNSVDVKFIPIEWHSSVRETDNARKMGLITLKTVPWLRRLNNDWLGDILYYLCDGVKILRDVVGKLNAGYSGFLADNPGFEGTFSVLAHSLGGLISYDILTGNIPAETSHSLRGSTYPRGQMRKPRRHDHVTPKAEVATETDACEHTPDTRTRQQHDVFALGTDVGGIASRHSEAESEAIATTGNAHSATTHGTTPLSRNTSTSPPSRLRSATAGEHSEVHGAEGAPEAKGTTPPDALDFGLDFTPAHLFILGSPLAGLLVFRDTPFESIPGCRVHNVFHPYDPLGYRLEPLINPEYADISPVILPHWNGGKRLHLLIRETYASRLQPLLPSVSSLSASLMALPASLQVPSFPRLEMPSLEMPRLDIGGISPADAKRRLGTFFVESMAHISDYLPPVHQRMADVAHATANYYSTEHIVEHVNEARRSLKRKFAALMELVSGPGVDATDAAVGSAENEVSAQVKSTPRKRRRTSRRPLARTKRPPRAGGAAGHVASGPATDVSDVSELPHAPDARTDGRPKRGSSCPPHVGLSRSNNAHEISTNTRNIRGGSVVDDAEHDALSGTDAIATALEYAEAAESSPVSADGFVRRASERVRVRVQRRAVGRGVSPSHGGRSRDASTGGLIGGVIVDGDGAVDVDLEEEPTSVRVKHEHLLAAPEEGQQHGPRVPPLDGHPRMDFSLQEHPMEIGSEYIFSVGSHASYWANKDVTLYVLATVHGIDADAVHNTPR